MLSPSGDKGNSSILVVAVIVVDFTAVVELTVMGSVGVVTVTVILHN